ncbi:putative quinate permease [Calycina marina]|uniref:Quinate permease n=1 Tax=Calycina marina TaxID=1763456 RepID=A0A9P7YUG8_9HELO|nr:putative quinate permease [Calycina marina]
MSSTAAPDGPKEVLNWRLWFAVFSFGIVAMVQIGSVGGAGPAFLLCDRISRLWATRQLCCLSILGVVIFLTNGGQIGQIYVGHFVVGLGIGQTTVVARVYLSDAAPYFLHMFGTKQQWVIPTTIHIMFVGIILILSFFNYEPPRYLVNVGMDDESTENLAQIRLLPVTHRHLMKEINKIKMQLHGWQEAYHGQGIIAHFKENFVMPNKRYRLYLGFCSQLSSQLSGAGSNTIYTSRFFALMGILGQNQRLYATAIFGVVELITSVICALFLINVSGCKLFMVYIAALLTAVSRLAEGQQLTSSQKHASTGAIVMIYFSGFDLSSRIRAISSGMVIAVLNILLPLDKGGLGSAGNFWLLFGITLIGGVWVCFFVPKTAGRSLEVMGMLSNLKWHQIDRYGTKDCREVGCGC